MISGLKIKIKSCVEEYVLNTYGKEISAVVEQPKNMEMGDIAVPVFVVMKAIGKPLPQVVTEIKELLLNSFAVIKEIVPTGGFLNIRVKKEGICTDILKEAITLGENYGNSDFGAGKTVVIDYSSPNIAKSFSIGHLRSTMIGNSLKLINRKCGFDVVGINYLGDWGTQFGKMIVAFKKWGDLETIKADPINELTKLYVLFHDKAKEDESLEDEAREAFRRLENNDSEYYELWKWIREESLKESEQIYDLLHVNFDSYNGEAYYNDKMDAVVDELTSKELLVDDQGAKIVRLGDDIPPALIKRRDGGSLYITRDLAAVFDRKNTYKFSKILYVVGNEQKLHFEQLKRVITKMGYDYASEINHINFGLVLQNGKKMSTRGGGVVKLYDVLDNAMKLAYEQIKLKNPNIENIEETARKVGCGAVVFNDLKNHRTLDYDFDMEKMLKFEGQTGPYLQYTGVRIASILRDNTYDVNNIDASLFANDIYFELARSIGEFKGVITRACEECAPSVVAKYLLGLAQIYNKFYANVKINVSEEAVRNTNFMISHATRIVINEGLRLLGIEYVEQM
jgi:arginyl-tRNA synthetase